MRFLSLVDEHVKNTEFERVNKRERKSHHPSSINKCVRAQYYDWTQTETTNATDTAGVYRMRLGTIIHGMFAEAIKTLPDYEVVEEMELTKEYPELKYPLHGYVDICLMKDGKKHGIEVKSTFGYGAKLIQQNQSPREDDVSQSQVYMIMDREFLDFDLIYFARDSFYRTEFDILMEQSERDRREGEVIDRLVFVEESVELKRVPFREYNAIVNNGELKDVVQRNNVKYKSDWQCMYCRYGNMCYKEEILSGGLIIPDQIISPKIKL